MPDGDFEIDLGCGERMVGDHCAGDDPGYVFLHGLGSARVGQKSESLRIWARRRHRAFTRCDFRGHGDSTGTIGQITIGELIADTVRLLESVGPSLIVGSSMGGLVGAFAAARRPELVRALALIAPAFGFLHRLDRTVDEDGCLVTTDGRRFPLARRVVEEARALDERGLPRQLHLPVLIAHGDRDEVVPHGRSERFFARLGHRRKALWIVPGGDHRLSSVAEEIWRRLDAMAG